MDALVIRIEIDPECATLLEALVETYLSERAARLSGGALVPIHTRAVLEKQHELAGVIDREIKRGLANPELVEIPS